MSRRPKQESAQASNVFQFTLASLIMFSLALMSGASFIAYKLATANRPKLSAVFAVDPNDKSRSVHVGPWGDLIVRNIELERPAKFLNEEVTSPSPETWTFGGMKPD